MAERHGHDGAVIRERVDAVANALRWGAFDPQHTGPLYLRESAASAIRDGLLGGVDVMIGVDGKADLPGARFMGLRVAPDLAVYPAGGAPLTTGSVQSPGLFDLVPRSKRDDVSGVIAVTITVLRQDARPVQGAISDSVILATRYAAVVVFVLDRRMARRDPFGGGLEGDVSALSTGDLHLIEVLSREHRVTLVVQRQDPFGFA
jgi:hypothetical protein